MINRHDVVVTEIGDAELYVIAAGGRTDDDLPMKLFRRCRKTDAGW
jgi:hypothetical protein